MADHPTVREATGAADMARVRKLFLDYQQRLGVDLSFQGFSDEIGSLPGPYARPRGCLLLAVDGDNVAGGVGMRPLEGADVCEMKQLFLYDRWQGRGLGRRLAVAIIDEARAMYRTLGFVECAPYYHNPLANVLYMEIGLATAGLGGA